MAEEKLLVLSVLLHLFSSFHGQQLGDDALEQCVASDALGVSKFEGDTGFVPDTAIYATSFMTKREGHMGRLFHNSVWQASSNNYNQFLQVDLGDRKLITRVATQGYRGSGQFVIDYYVSYSNDNTTFTEIVNDLGEAEVFPGNTHDDKPQFNTFDYPVVARYVRFYPRRWNINIAMRVELYGCDYTGKAAYFNGQSRISFDAHTPNTLFTTTDVVRFRFKTNENEGLIFYGGGNQGDYLVLELHNGRMYIGINLGTLSWGDYSKRGVVGSLLDDNQWHDVELTRQDKNVTVSVDRVPVNVTVEGEFTRLDLDRYLYLGGVNTFYQPGITVRQNFVGCIENFVWNGIHMTRDKDVAPRFQTEGNVLSSCPDGDNSKPLTLPEPGSHMVYQAADITANSLQFKLQFRTFDKDRLLLWNEMNRGGSFIMRIGQEGHIEFEMLANEQGYVIKEIAKSDHNSGSYADGLWHTLQFEASKNQIILVIDDKDFVTTRTLEFEAGDTFYLGGGHPEQEGFVGCLRAIRIMYAASTSNDDLACPVSQAVSNPKCYTVLADTCGMEDRCRPNPCEHGSVCDQTYQSFTCNCTDTGYRGATCHQSLYPNSCSRVFELRKNTDTKVDQTIDIDGAGALEPFDVSCGYNTESQLVETWLSHDVTHEVLVDGFNEPGSYQRQINYAADVEIIDQLVYRADSCKQQIAYRCESSRLLENPGTSSGGGGDGGTEDGTGPELGQVYEAYGWWIGRNYQFNYYWGGSAPGTHKCACGLQGTCQQDEPRCNCDAGLNDQGISDSGFLMHKEHLPVLELRFGDTGSLYDSKRGWHTLGPLICAGDRLFDQPVTFRKFDSIIFFDTFWTRDSWELNTWDISFRFKTTAENGVMVYRSGANDFIEIKLVTSTTMSFRFNAGYGVQAVTNEVPFILNDNQWHTVYAERNRKEALLQVDEFEATRIPHPLGVGYIKFLFDSPLYVGATQDFKDGFVGCMSSLQYNGETLDLYDKVQNDPRFSYGLSTGCVGKCDENPCLNDGRCQEKYDQFICDCSFTPFRGLICGREVGVSIYGGQKLIYSPQYERKLKTVNENITLGFFTRKKGGILMQLVDDLDNPKEYMSVEINSGGGIRVAFLVDAQGGNSRQQVNTAIGKGIEFANGQPHIIKFSRTNGGKIFLLQVDDYEPIVEEDLSTLYPTGADVYLENIKYIVLGNGQATSDNQQADGNTAFVGCIFRVQFDNHWPLKRIFQEPRPDYVDVKVNSITNFTAVREERCGFEEELPDPVEEEVRPTYEPPPRVDPDEPTLDEQTSGQSAAYLGAIFGFVGIILIVIISVVVYKCRHVGAYPDSEEDELEMLDTSDNDKNDDYEESYRPRSTSERYQTKVPPSEQAFI